MNRSPNDILDGLRSGSSVGASVGIALAVGASLQDHSYLYSLPSDPLSDVVARSLHDFAHAGFAISRNEAAAFVHIAATTLLGAVGGALLGALPLGRLRRWVAPVPLSLVATVALTILTAIFWTRRGIAGGVEALAFVALALAVWNAGVAWSIDRLARALGRWSAALAVFALVVVLSALSIRTSAPTLPTASTAEAGAPAAPRPLLLVGLDAAAWTNLERALAAGQLPNLAALRKRGAWGELQSIGRTLSPVVWNTIATGQRPAEHGILDFALNGTPYTSNSRTTWAMWEILPKFGLRSAFHYWWASWPSEEVDGRIVSDRFLMAGLDRRAHPESDMDHLDALAEQARARVRPISEALGPGGDSITPEFLRRHTRKLGVLEEFLLRDELVTRLGEDAIESGRFELVGVYLRGMDAVGHTFWKWHYHAIHPTFADWVYGPADEDQAILAPVVRRMNDFVDEWLGRMLTAAGEDWNVVVVSDHGMTATITRFPGKRGEPETANHHLSGLLLMAGPDIREGVTVRGASIYDVFPTVLYLLGLPIPEDLPGRVLAEALEPSGPALPPIRLVEGYGARPDIAREPIPTVRDDDYLERLRALGYVVD